ncbi:hypothetical protein GCM10027052_27480 [Parafrigoribacterium mesophilum]|uniref:hypothetical protein n=1 Tax=Parafrigoribacterium mesophilum TaxID=433646 RepID=UPI0031FD0D99
MTSRKWWFCLAVPVLLTLSACSAPGGASEAASSTEGAIELAVSETCIEASDPQCVSVNGQNVALPAAYQRVGVTDAAAAEGGGQHAVDVTLTHDGAAVLHSLTKKAAQAGQAARLVIKIGDEIRGAVVVMQALEGDQLQIALSPDDNAQEVVQQIQGTEVTAIDAER